MVFLTVKDDDFDQAVHENSKPVVADFWAPWCGPCKLFSKIFEKLADELEGMKFIKVNTDEAQDVTEKMGVRSVPTIIIFKNGEEQERLAGVLNEERFRSVLEKHLA